MITSASVSGVAIKSCQDCTENQCNEIHGFFCVDITNWHYCWKGFCICKNDKYHNIHMNILFFKFEFARIVPKENAWKVRSTDIVMTSTSQSQKQNYGEGRNRKRKWYNLWELETVFCLNRFTSHRATKTWVSWKLFHSNLFSLTIMFNIKIMIAMIHLRIICFPFHTERSPAKIQPALNDNPGLLGFSCSSWWKIANKIQQTFNVWGLLVNLIYFEWYHFQCSSLVFDALCSLKFFSCGQ